MAFEEQELRAWVRRVASEEVRRRDFIRTMLELGLSGPLIAEMLATYAPAAAQGTPNVQQTFTPARRGGGSCVCWIGRRPRSSTPTSPPAERTSKLRASSTNR